jgi:hypothetical protein
MFLGLAFGLYERGEDIWHTDRSVVADAFGWEER